MVYGIRYVCYKQDSSPTKFDILSDVIWISSTISSSDKAVVFEWVFEWFPNSWPLLNHGIVIRYGLWNKIRLL